MTNKTTVTSNDRLTKHAKLRILRDKVAKYMKTIKLSAGGAEELKRFEEFKTELKTITHSVDNAAGNLITSSMNFLTRKLSRQSVDALREIAEKKPAIKKPVTSKRVNGKSKAFSALPGKPLKESDSLYGLAQKHAVPAKTVKKVKPTMTVHELEEQILAVENAVVTFRVPEETVISTKGYPYRQRLKADSDPSKLQARINRTVRGTCIESVDLKILRLATTQSVHEVAPA